MIGLAEKQLSHPRTDSRKKPFLAVTKEGLLFVIGCFF